MSKQPQFVLRLVLEAPYGKSYSAAMPIDAFEAMDRYVGLTPPSEFDLAIGARTMEETVERIRKREYRKDDFEQPARRLARLFGERMEDEEGWPDAALCVATRDQLSLSGNLDTARAAIEAMQPAIREAELRSDFIRTIHERTPGGEWIAVQHHPNGDWSVANAPLGFAPEPLTPDELSDLADRAEMLYDKCKLFPEKSPGGQIAMIELRNLAPELIAAVRAFARDKQEWIEPPRIEE